MLALILSVVLLGVPTQALAFNAPRATQVSVAPVQLAQGPLPTKAPPLAELLKRQTSNSDTLLTALFGTSSLCGYISGVSAGAYACGTAFTCNFLVGSVTGTSTSYGEVACCNDSFCAGRTTCVDYVDYWTSSLCGDSCATNTAIAKCTGLALPYCNGIRFVDDWAQDWFCDSTTVSSWQLAYTTTAGEPDDRGFVLTTWDPNESTTAASGARGSETGAAPAPASFTVTLSPSTTLQSGPSTTLKSVPSGATPVVPSRDAHPVGAIAGGVVGGVVIIALAGWLWWYCLRRRRRNNTAGNNGPAAVYNNVSPPQQVHTGEPQMTQNLTPDQNTPGGFAAGYFKPEQAGHTVHEVDSNPTSPGDVSSHRVSNATELDSHPGSPTPSHAVSTVASTMNSTYFGQQPSPVPYVTPSDQIHEMSATSGPWEQNLEGIHEMPSPNRRVQ